jgi:hypothetical protein
VSARPRMVSKVIRGLLELLAALYVPERGGEEGSGDQDEDGVKHVIVSLAL